MTDQNNGEPAGLANVTSLSSDAAAEMIMAMEEKTTEQAPEQVATDTVETPETEDEVELEANAEGEMEPEGDGTPDENENFQDGDEIDEGEENQADEIEAYDLDKISGETQIRLRDGTVVTGAELKEKIDLFNQANEVKAQNDEMRATLEQQAAQIEQQRLQYEQEANNFSQIAPVAYQELQNSLPDVPNPPTDAEWDEDHFAAVRKQADHQRARDEYNQKRHRMEQIKAQAQSQYQAAQQKTAQQEMAAAQEEGQKLIKLKPELRDETMRIEFKNSLIEGAKKHFGYSDEQLSKLASARDVVALSAAIENAELKANPPKPATKTKTTTRNKPLAGSSRRESQGEVAANEKSKSFAKVRQTGRSEDAARLIANLDL